MNKEEIESFDTLEINLNDIDDVDMGLEITSYRARKNMQEFADAIMKYQQQITKLNNKIEKIKEYVKKRLKHNEDYIKTESEDANSLYILSIIDEENK